MNNKLKRAIAAVELHNDSHMYVHFDDAQTASNLNWLASLLDTTDMEELSEMQELYYPDQSAMQH